MSMAQNFTCFSLILNNDFDSEVRYKVVEDMRKIEVPEKTV